MQHKKSLCNRLQCLQGKKSFCWSIHSCWLGFIFFFAWFCENDTCFVMWLVYLICSFCFPLISMQEPHDSTESSHWALVTTFCTNCNFQAIFRAGSRQINIPLFPWKDTQSNSQSWLTKVWLQWAHKPMVGESRPLVTAVSWASRRTCEFRSIHSLCTCSFIKSAARSRTDW